MKKTMILLVAFSLIGSVVFAQTTEAYKEHPGYVDFGSFEKFQNAAKTVDISIKGPLLNFVSKITAGEDPELSQLLQNLLLIQVNVFSVKEQQIGDVNAIIQNASKTLTSRRWERMVRVQDQGEHVEVYTQFGDTGALTGLVVMALGKNQEAVFVNIVGTLDPEQLGKLSAKFNIPKLDELDFGNKEKVPEKEPEEEPETKKQQ
jgi:hypothetical protein